MPKRGIRLGLAAAVWFGALSRAAHDLWAATALFAWLSVLAVLFMWGNSREKASVKAPLAPALLLWAGAAVLSMTRSYDANTTSLEIAVWLFCLLFFGLFVNSAENEAERDEFFTAAGASAVPVGLIAAWQWFTAVSDRAEIHATLINSSLMAGFALCWIFFFGRNALVRRRLVLPFAACLALLLVARSWWAYVSLCAGLVYFFRVRARELARRRPAEAAALASAAAVVFAAVVFLKVRVHSGPFVGAARLYYWRAALAMFASHPSTGVGLGGYQTAYPFFRGDYGGSQNTLFAHDFPLQLLAETGIAGAVAAAAAAWSVARSVRPADAERDVWGATLTALLCFGLTSIFFEFFLSKLLLMVLLGSLVGGAEVPKFKLRPLWAAAAAAGLALVSVFWLRPLAASRLLVSGFDQERAGNSPGAEKLYRDAAGLDPTLADADWALYRLERARYESSHSPEDLRRASGDLLVAIRLKKSTVFLAEAAALQRATR
ncbi:MAG: O-antigen ligase family protein [Elusimicrobiota bacterium]